MADKDFKVKDSDFSYTVNLPDDTPPAEVYRIARAQATALGLVKGPAAPVAPKNPQAEAAAGKGAGVQLKPEAPDISGGGGVFDELKQNNVKGAATDVATSAAIGGAMGFAAPEIAKGLGAGLMRTKNPYAMAGGVALTAAGQAMEGHRLALTVDGIVSGTTSELAGQAADVTDFAQEHPWAGTAARVAGGVGGSSVLTGIGHLMSGTAGALHKAYTAIVGTLDGKEAALQAAKNNLRNGAVSSLPQQEVHETVAKGAQAEIAAAVKRADQIREQAKVAADKVRLTNLQEAQRLTSEAEKKAAAVEKAAYDRADAAMIASKGKLATAARVRAMADHERANIIGEPKLPTEIGEPLRADLEEAQGIEYATRSAKDAELRATRNADIDKKLAAGQEIADHPQLKELADDLAKTALLNPKGVKAATRADVTDPGTERAYRQLWDSLRTRRYQVGENAAGNPIFKTLKPSFQALDVVRRRLADVGKPGVKGGAEGYEALGEKFAHEMAKKIGKIQEDYVGESQRALQETYHEGSQEVRKVTGGLAGKSTAVDRIDPQSYAMDPAELPGHWFKTPQKVQDLQILIGEEKANKYASEWLSEQLSGLNSKQVSAYINKSTNKDWMRQVGGLLGDKGTATLYLKRLQQIEKVAEGQEARAAALAEGATKARTAASKEAGDIVADTANVVAGMQKTSDRLAEQTVKKAGEKAGKLTAETDKRVQKWIKSGIPQQDVHKFLNTASKEEFEAVSKKLAATPGGMKALEGSARQMTADLTPETLRKTWNTRLDFLMKRTLPQTEYKKLASDVQKVLDSQNPKQAVTKVQRMVSRALTIPAAGVGTAAERRARNALTDWGSEDE